jgi:hypothetical protein
MEFKKLNPPRFLAKPSTEDALTSPLTPEPAGLRPSAPEYWLLKILFIHEDLVEWAAAHLDVNWLRHPLVRTIVSARLNAFSDGTWQGLPAFLHQMEDPITRQLITEAASEKREIPEPEKALKGDAARKGIVETLRNDYLDQQMAELQRRAGQANLSEDEIARIETQKMEIRQMKRQSLHPLIAG